jgi:prepilin-type N-terminal cleavage/methylation domain-containing protein
MTHAHVRRGVTLIELMVAITLIAVLAGVSTVTLRAAGRASSADTAAARIDATIAATRDSAVRTGTAVTAEVRLKFETSPARFTALPDGSVVGDASLPVERTTGRALSRDVR